jgi:hypothetical protein
MSSIQIHVKLLQLRPKRALSLLSLRWRSSQIKSKFCKSKCELECGLQHLFCSFCFLLILSCFVVHWYFRTFCKFKYSSYSIRVSRKGGDQKVLFFLWFCFVLQSINLQIFSNWTHVHSTLLSWWKSWWLKGTKIDFSSKGSCKERTWNLPNPTYWQIDKGHQELIYFKIQGRALENKIWKWWGETKNWWN